MEHWLALTKTQLKPIMRHLTIVKIILSEFFYLFKNNEKESGITFSRIELFRDYAWIIKPLLYITILLIFITLYLVKIGCLQ